MDLDKCDFVDVKEACPQCGEKRASVRDGFLYCIECGMRAAESQPILDFTIEGIGDRTRFAARNKVTKPKADNYENMWSTWHAHNMILVGLVEEICSCGAKEFNLGQTVLMLWVRWLRHNRIAFFSRKNISIPKVTFGFMPRDLEYLYGFENTKKRKRRVKSTATKLRHEMDLVREEYAEFKASQSTNLDMLSQNLDDLKVPDLRKSKKIEFNRKFQKAITKTMSPEDIELHKTSGVCGVKCKCFKKKKCNVSDRVNQLSIFNLYAILFLGLRIIDDNIFLGDLLRWCRESHLSYGSYKHFFPNDMAIKTGDRLSFNVNCMSHKMLRRTAGTFARVLKIRTICSPNLDNLIKRYLKELQLPNELFIIIIKLKNILPKLCDYDPNVGALYPNYEAIAMSYIIIALKIIFGLDGVTENKISSSADHINVILNLDKMTKNQDGDNVVDSKNVTFNRIFVWKDWVQYIEYRKICVSQCHYPTLLRLYPDNLDNPELFLHHKKTTDKNVDSGSSILNPEYLVLKSLLDNIQTDHNALKKEFPTFSCSIYPMLSYSESLLTWDSPYFDLQICKDLLNEDFPSYNINSLLNPRSLKSKLAKLNYLLITERCMSNLDVAIDKGLKKSFEELSDRFVSCETNKIVQVTDCSADKWTESLESENITNFLSKSVLNPKNQKKILEPKLFKNNSYKIYLKPSFKTALVKVSSKIKKSVSLYVCYQNFWLRHYPTLVKFKKKSFEEELDKSFPPSFAWLLRECAATTEMSTLDLYKELCDIEKRLVLKKKSPIVENVSKPLGVVEDPN